MAPSCWLKILGEGQINSLISGYIGLLKQQSNTASYLGYCCWKLIKVKLYRDEYKKEFDVFLCMPLGQLSIILSSKTKQKREKGGVGSGVDEMSSGQVI